MGPDGVIIHHVRISPVHLVFPLLLFVLQQADNPLVILVVLRIHGGEVVHECAGQPGGFQKAAVLIPLLPEVQAQAEQPQHQQTSAG